MVTPFEVYLVMQLDAICMALLIASLVVPFLLAMALAFIDATYSDGTIKKWHVIACAVFCCVLWVTTALMPSSKTAAAMIILPKLASQQNMDKLGKEAGELYGLAKKALEKAATD